MRGGVALLVAALMTAALCLAARAQNDEFPCDAFVRNGDGSWTATQATYIYSVNFSVRKGGVFRRGDTYKGLDLAAKLDEVCSNAAPAPPMTAAPPPGTAAPPAAAARVPQQLPSLAKFADANGNIDVSRLSCGHLADASAEDAALLLAWYSGAFGRTAKARTVNLARLRYESRGLIDYCKVNRSESLTKAMDAALR